jgi:molybdate transport system substrate-binding protein
MSNIKIFAAGSLRYAFSLIAVEYKKLYKQTFDIEFGPAGLLRERIENGEKADIFASANTAHPRQLLQTGLTQKVISFAHNALCLIIRDTALFAGTDWFSALMVPDTVIGISTPGSDPCGDYALEFFEKLEKTNPGIGMMLKSRAVSLVGGKTNPVPEGVHPALYLIGENRADIFIGYKSGAVNLNDRRVRVLDIPQSNNIDAVYALALGTKDGISPEAQRLAEFISSAAGKNCLRSAGFKTAT